MIKIKIREQITPKGDGNSQPFFFLFVLLSIN